MKRSILIATLILVPVFFIAAQTYSSNFNSMSGWTEASGDWDISGGRLYQLDTEESISQIYFRVPQRGKMQYEFDVRYESGGIEDRMGGFGIHIFADEMCPGRSWGVGNSVLMWINYDEDATYGKSGFRAQVYKSTSNTEMSILENYDVALPVSVLKEENADVKVPAKIVVDGTNGNVKVYDPTVPNYVYKFSLNESLGGGDYFTFRTNSLSVSFDNFKVQRVD